MLRITMLLGVTLVIVGLGLAIDAQSRAPVERPQAPLPLPAISASGRIEGATPEVQLRPQLTGRVDEIVVREGRQINKGEVLLRLDARQYQREVDLAAAELARAEAELERLVNGARPQERHEAAALHRAKQAELDLARTSYQRTRRLHETNSVPEQQLDDHKSRVEALLAETAAAKARVELLEAPARTDEVAMAQARIEAAKAKLELAETWLDRTELRAPTGGQVLKINVEPGELAGPETVEPAMILVDTEQPRVRAFVEEFDAPRVRLGMPAEITVDGLPDKVFRGQVIQISPRMSRKALWTNDPTERYDTKVREVLVELQDCRDLAIGLRVDVLLGKGPRSP